MNEKFSDELISAYLDGEVTADEQAAVESALRDNVEFRRMFDELQTLRSSLQSLPRYTLDDAFSQRVLRRAERAMLAPSASNVAPAAAAANVVQKVSSDAASDAESARREVLRWRRLFWAASAVAAGLMGVLLVPTLGPERSVTMQSPRGDTTAYKQATSAESTPADSAAASPALVASPFSAPEPTVAADSGAQDADARQPFGRDRGVRDASGRRQDRPAEASGAVAPANSGGLGEPGAARIPESRKELQASAANRPVEDAKKFPKAAQAVDQLKGTAADSVLGKAADKSAGERPAPVPMNPTAASPALSSPAPAPEAPRGADVRKRAIELPDGAKKDAQNGAKNGFPTSDANSTGADAFGSAPSSGATAAADQFQVVNLRVRGDRSQAAAILAILTRNQIDLVEEPLPKSKKAAGPSAGEKSAGEKSAAAPPATTSRPAPPASPAPPMATTAGGSAPTPLFRAPLDDAEPDGGGVQLIYVEATSGQVAASLAALEAIADVRLQEPDDLRRRLANSEREQAKRENGIETETSPRGSAVQLTLPPLAAGPIVRQLQNADSLEVAKQMSTGAPPAAKPFAASPLAVNRDGGAPAARSAAVADETKAEGLKSLARRRLLLVIEFAEPPTVADPMAADPKISQPKARPAPAKANDAEK